MSSDWIKFVKNYRWEIMVCLSILFFIILMIFHKSINKWLKDKEDFMIGNGKKIIIGGGSGGILKKNESRCRQIFELIFRRPFQSVRPAFLKRSNGYSLELDGYNSDLKLAFEYQGVQHYKYSPRFHKSEKDFADQLKRDQDKRAMCAKAGVKVIEIPYIIKYEKLEGYIRNELRNLGYI